MWPWSEDKKGAILVLVAFLFVGLFGMLAIAIDLSRLMVSRNQMQIAADAGALAAAVSMLQGDPLGAIDSAVTYAVANQADADAMSEDSAVTFGVWDDTPFFQPRADPSGSNAIRVRAGQTTANLAAWILGAGTTDARASAIALLASVTETTCLKPIAVAQETVDTDNDGVISQLERDAVLGREVVLHHVGVDSVGVADAPFYYYAMVLPPFWDASDSSYSTLPPGAMGDAALQANIATCNLALVGVSDSVLTKPGANYGPMRNGLLALCGEIDPVSYECNSSGANSADGRPGIPVLMPLWDGGFTPLGRAALGVRELAAFRIMAVIDNASSLDLSGHFIRIVDGGKAEPGIGFIERPILVR